MLHLFRNIDKYENKGIKFQSKFKVQQWEKPVKPKVIPSENKGET